MNFRRAVVDPERTDVAKGALDHRVARDADRSENLDTAIDDTEQRFRNKDFTHGGFVTRLLMLVEFPGRVPDGQARHVQVDLVIGQHESDPLVLAERPSEGVPPSRVVDGDRVTTPRLAEPA